LFEKLRCEELNTLTKSDDEDTTGVVEVEHGFDNGSGVFMAERRTACRYAIFLAYLGYTPQ
jgi:hypothetical protein